MYSKISVLIPTRHRIERLQTLLDSVRHTTYGFEIEMVFRIDDDDHESEAFLRAQRVHHDRVVVVVGPRLDGYRSMPTFFNEMAKASTGSILMCGNDDMVFQTQDWPTYIIDVANQFPDGLFDLGVDTMNRDNFPFSTVSRRAVERMGFLWDPRIFWGDIFLRDVMSFFGRCYILPNVRIDHDWAGFKPDRTYIEQLEVGEATKDILRRNPNYWTEVHQTAVNESVDRLRGLLA